LSFWIAAVLAIFLLLQTAFGSWRLAVLTFFTLPVSLVGGLLAIRVTSGVISLGSLIGLLVVFALALRNSIVLVSRYRALERREGEAFSAALVVQGAQERLAPTLLTALALSLAMVPIVISGNIPGLEIVYPMALVTLGGLLTSMLLTLFVVPTLYLRF